MELLEGTGDGGVNSEPTGGAFAPLPPRSQQLIMMQYCVCLNAAT